MFMNAWSCPHCSKCVCFETKKVSKGVVSQALKGFGCKLGRRVRMSVLLLPAMGYLSSKSVWSQDALLACHQTLLLTGIGWKKNNRNVTGHFTKCIIK